MLLGGITALYTLQQVRATRAQNATTQFFERFKLTKEVLDDPKLVEPLRWIVEFQNTFPFRTCLEEARLAIHVQNMLSFSELQDADINKHALSLMRALTYVAQISKYGALIDELYFERNAVEIVHSYYCMQAIVDVSQRDEFMSADVRGFSLRAWEWLRQYMPGSFLNYPVLKHGFASDEELRELTAEASRRVAQIKSAKPPRAE